MASFNKVILVGNLTRDPEMRYTPKGTAVCQVGLAVNRVWTNEAGEKKEEVTFIDLTSFGRTAEVIAQYLRKGSPALFEGRLRLEQWDDKQTGAKRSKLSVVIESMQLLGSKPADDGGGAPQQRAAAPQGRSFPRRTPDATSQADAADGGFQSGPPDPDDVPF